MPKVTCAVDAPRSTSHWHHEHRVRVEEAAVADEGRDGECADHHPGAGGALAHPRSVPRLALSDCGLWATSRRCSAALVLAASVMGVVFRSCGPVGFRDRGVVKVRGRCGGFVVGSSWALQTRHEGFGVGRRQATLAARDCSFHNRDRRMRSHRTNTRRAPCSQGRSVRNRSTGEMMQTPVRAPSATWNHAFQECDPRGVRSQRGVVRRHSPRIHDQNCYDLCGPGPLVVSNRHRSRGCGDCCRSGPRGQRNVAASAILGRQVRLDVQRPVDRSSTASSGFGERVHPVFGGVPAGGRERCTR